MELIRKFVNQHRIKLGVGVAATVGAVVGACLYLAKSTEDGKPDAQISGNNSVVLGLKKSEAYKQNIENLKKILLATGGMIPTPQVLLLIVKAQIELYRSSFIALYVHTRNLRRKFIAKPEEYAKRCIQGNDDGETLYKEAETEVLNQLGISLSYFGERLNEFSLANPDIQNYIGYMYHRVKVQVTSPDRPITREEAVQFFQMQIDQIDGGQIPRFESFDPMISHMCKVTYVTDVVCMKTGLEEEDIAKDLSLLKDRDVERVLKALQEKVEEL